jgi:hypothetical protein
LRTYCSAAAAISSEVAGGAKFDNVLMLRHMTPASHEMPTQSHRPTPDHRQ